MYFSTRSVNFYANPSEADGYHATPFESNDYRYGAHSEEILILTRRLSTLTEDLQATAGHFRRGANQVRKRM